MELHAVIIHKPIALSEAQKIANEYIKNKKFYRETKTSYKFRNKPKQHFKSFKSKKINKYITLVYGEPKIEPKIKGTGYIERGNVGGSFLNKINDFILKYNPFSYIAKKVWGAGKQDLEDKGYFKKSNKLPY